MTQFAIKEWFDTFKNKRRYSNSFNFHISFSIYQSSLVKPNKLSAITRLAYRDDDDESFVLKTYCTFWKVVLKLSMNQMIL